MTTVLTIVLLLAVAGALSLRLLLTRDTEVRRFGCSAASAVVGDGATCAVCGARPTEACRQ